jgi:hypothetical protein
VKKVITAVALLAGLAACTRSSATTRPVAAGMPPAGTSGGADPTSAVRGFMAAAKLQSVQSLSMWWGDANGPTREQMDKDELEKRELIMLKCLKHDRYDLVGEAPTTGGAHDVILNVIYHETANTTHLTLVVGPHNRWYVKDVDLKPLQAVCVG